MLSFKKSRPKELKGLKKDFRFEKYFLDVYVVDRVMYVRDPNTQKWWIYPLQERSAIEFKNNFSEAYRVAFLQGDVLLIGALSNNIEILTFEVFPYEFGIELYRQGFLESVGYVENVMKEVE